MSPQSGAICASLSRLVFVMRLHAQRIKHVCNAITSTDGEVVRTTKAIEECALAGRAASSTSDSADGRSASLARHSRVLANGCGNVNRRWTESPCPRWRGEVARVLLEIVTSWRTAVARFAWSGQS